MSQGLDRQAKNRRWEYLRHVGRPSLVGSESREYLAAARRLRILRSKGMSYGVMAQQCGAHQTTLSEMAAGKRKSIRRTTANAIMTMVFVEPESPGAQVEMVGTQRRLQALRAEGYTYEFLCGLYGWSKHNPTVQRIMQGVRTDNGRAVTRVAYSTARTAAQAYDKLAGADPSDYGIPDWVAQRGRKKAAELGYAPSSCWDPDTIDDPMAIPQWTGQCGTWIGARAHHREGIPMCPNCAPHDLGVKVPGFSAQKLRDLRERKGYSRISLGEAAGFHPSTIQYWEDGRSVPEREWKIDKLLSVLDATFEDVIEEEA